MTTTIHDENDDTLTVRSINERPPSYECIMALNEELVKRHSALISSIKSREDSNMSIDSTLSKEIDMNGNLTQSIISPNEPSDYYNNNNNNSDGPNTSSLFTTTTANSFNDELNNNNIIPAENSDEDSIDLDIIKSNGIIKLDMSRIMDKTGLPTYEAALKLKSSNYI